MHHRRLQYIPLKYRYEQIKEIEDSLHDLGVSKDQIDKTTEFFYNTYREDHVKKVVNAVIQDTNAPEELKKKLEAYEKGGIPGDYRVADVVASYKYTPSSETSELIEDSKYFDEEKKFRRIYTWQ